MDNIQRAIQRASGRGDGAASLEELVYEGYSPGGAAVMVIALTDNRNRSASEIRQVFERHNSKLGQLGTVAWLFEQKGVISLEAQPQRAEEIAMTAIDLGAEDFELDGSLLEVRTSPERFEELRRALIQQGATVTKAEVTMVPKSLTLLDPHNAQVTLRLLDRLEELEDVQKVFTNADFPADALERYQQAA
jgi:YebC/PmpR family DNA-binding regulatory protein